MVPLVIPFVPIGNAWDPILILFWVRGNAKGTIGSPNGTIGTIGKPMVPLVTQWYHWLPMVPLVRENPEQCPNCGVMTNLGTKCPVSLKFIYPVNTG